MLADTDRPDTEFRKFGGHTVPVAIRHSDRALRLSAKIDPDHDRLDVVVPYGVSERSVNRFLKNHAAWAVRELNALPPRVRFTHDAIVPVLGRDCALVHLPLLPPEVWREGDELVVGGPSPDLADRVSVWCRDLARNVLTERADEAAGRLGRDVKAITVRDQRTRWGSCSPDGRLSFSWRLVLAPYEVLDYVVAHEVAHLAELNHSPKFWRLVAWLCPGYAEARDWLRQNPFRLRRYG